MMEKNYLLENMDALRRTVEALPDNVVICDVHRYGGKPLSIQILQHPDVREDSVEVRGNGSFWCEKNYGTGVIVGWLKDEAMIE